MPNPARITRRRVAALLAGGTALLVAGCGESEAPAPTPTAATPAQTSPPPPTATSTARTPSLSTPSPATVAATQPATAPPVSPTVAPVAPVATVAAPRPTRPPPQTAAPTAAPSPEPTTPPPTPEPTPTPTPTPAPIRSPLTGLEIDPNARAQRVVAVKIDNAIGARPQSGLSTAGVVYEHVTEGSVTRYTAFFLDSDLDRVGPIRSSRFVDRNLVQQFDALFAHVGASPPVMQDLRSSPVGDRGEGFLD
ncbi:MAG: DUF3048 domain-containing protein, partial [Chloroflexi bacterium]|nr:DUF3048 domain-containing protein [Chloroflexota bacterium]